nr:AraC family transcriptional regulator [Nocardia cyriacigeorgica]
MAHYFHDPQQLRASLTGQETSAYRLLRWNQHGDRTASRTRRHVREVPGDDFYWVVIPERGTYSMRFGDEVIRVPTGRAILTGMEVACGLHIPDSTAFAFQIPRAEVDHRLRPSGHLRAVIDMSRGLGRVAGEMIRTVSAEEADLTDRDFNAICDRVTELLCMLCAGDTQPQPLVHAEVAESIRRHLREHIGHSDVRLPAVAKALGWSPRQLRLVLQQHGTTFRDMRRDEALRVARDLLEDPRTNLSIAELATRSGFTPNWFSAAFKERFGQSPREFRKHRLEQIADEQR